MRVCKTHIGFGLHGNEMDMCVGHFQPEHALSDFDARNGALDGKGHFLCKDLESCQFIVFKVEDIIYLALGNNQSMSLLQGTDVEKGVVTLILSNLVARYLAGYNAGENAWHFWMKD